MTKGRVAVHVADEQDQQMAAVCKALAHPVRIKMLSILKEQDVFCGDLVKLFGLAQSTVSHHLKALREAGIITGREQGTAVCYRINYHRIEEFQDWVKNL